MNYFRKLCMLLPTVALITMASCERRPLEESISYTARLPISIDWSESSLDRSHLNAVSAYFFPLDGSEPILKVSNNVDTFYVDVPVGDYAVLIFNEWVGHGWFGVEFTGTENYSTFLAKAVENTTGRGNPLYTKTTGDNLIVEPEPLAAWAMDSVSVTQEMVTYTRSSTRSSLSARAMASVRSVLNKFVRLKPQPRTAKVELAARVSNLNSTDAEYGLTGSANGFASGVYMASGKTITPRAIQLFTFNPSRYVWDDENSRKDGIAHQTFYTFGRTPLASFYTLKLDVLLRWGNDFGPFLFDISSQVQSSSTLLINLNVGLEERGSEDHTIILPPATIDGVSVSDWNQNNVEIK